MIYITTVDSPLGQATLACDSSETQLIGLWLKGQQHFLDTVSEEMILRDDIALFDEVKSWLERYFKGENPLIGDIPLAPRGSAFQTLVWQLLVEIPYGEVTTYKLLAEKCAHLLGREKMSAQAVGGAVGRNPISIIIPCHRVVGTNGSLVGYAGGIEKKISLLSLEGFDVSRYSLPRRKESLPKKIKDSR